MLHPTPRYCQQHAFDAFTRHVPDVEETEGLVSAATAIAMHAMDDADPDTVGERLDEIADQVLRRLQSESRRALMAHLHHVLFEEERFEGNKLDYYDPANSYLPAVLETKRGIPITLALIYKAVAERLGVQVHGIGAPGHFLVRVEDEEGPMLVDAFHGGRVLVPEDAYRLMEGVLGAQIPREEEFLQSTSHVQWLGRMLRNLESIHTRRARPRDAAAMQELRHVLERHEPGSGMGRD